MPHATKTTSTGDTQITVRLSGKLVAALESLAAHLSRPGLALTRTDVVRLALEEGVSRLAPERRKAPRR